jgi:pilus assembly protein Flp/PilA
MLAEGKSALIRLRSCTRGATAIEYGLLAALIAVAAIAALTSVGGSLGGVFIEVSDALATP